jgi:3-oxoacyl-[acyl-carrier-protein] synthase-3
VNKVYITALSKFLPNNPISNDEMEGYLGLINDKPSRSRSIILRNNKIKTRYYAIDKNGNSTHSNAQLSAEAIRGLENENFKLSEMELLAGGTTSPDLLLPSHTTMVQGELGINSVEILSAAGSCNAGMQAFKYGFLSVMAGNTKNAIVFGSEKLSTWMHAKNFKKESEKWKDLENKPILAFEKDFLRWMLSDGAAAALLENEPNKEGISLEIEWVEFKSFSNELDTCMYAGGEKLENGQVKPWRDYSPDEIMEKSLFAMGQDVTMLGENIVKKGSVYLKEIIEKRNVDTNDITYFLPHISSEYFRQPMIDDFKSKGLNIPGNKWYTNLTRLGNVGSASIYFMMEELFNSGKLNKGEKILLMVPESARFSYAYALLTVV